ncbi:hypothetical protein [Mucilaginibacter sp.]
MEDLTETLVICALLLIIALGTPFFLSRKLRVIKYVSWVIAAFLALFLFIIVPYNGYWTDKEAKYRVGVYQLDITNSNYHRIDLSKFKSITLKLKGDYTFLLNENAPFLVSQSGTWLYWIDGDEPIIKLKFNNANYQYSVSRVDPDIVLDGSLLKEAKPGDKIAFKPKK